MTRLVYSAITVNLKPCQSTVHIILTLVCSSAVTTTTATGVPHLPFSANFIFIYVFRVACMASINIVQNRLCLHQLTQKCTECPLQKHEAPTTTNGKINEAHEILNWRLCRLIDRRVHVPSHSTLARSTRGCTRGFWLVTRVQYHYSCSLQCDHAPATHPLGLSGKSPCHAPISDLRLPREILSEPRTGDFDTNTIL